MARAKENNYEEIAKAHITEALLEAMFFWALGNYFFEGLYKFFFQGRYYLYGVWLTMAQSMNEVHPFVSRYQQYSMNGELWRVQTHLRTGSGRMTTYTMLVLKDQIKYYTHDCVRFFVRHGILKYGADHDYVRHVKKDILPRVRELQNSCRVLREEDLPRHEGNRLRGVNYRYAIFMKEHTSRVKKKITICPPTVAIQERLLTLEEKYFALSVVNKHDLESQKELAVKFHELKEKK